MYKVVLYWFRDFLKPGLNNHYADTSLLVRKLDLRKGQVNIKFKTSQTDIKGEKVQKDESKVGTNGDNNVRSSDERKTGKPWGDDLQETAPTTV